MNKNRLEAFSDGVFAIVITLLILDIKIPPTDYDHLPDALLHLLPRLISYCYSFIIIGVYWISHHNISRRFLKIDRVILWLNILFLLLVAFIPFPTSLMGEYPFKKLPLVLYGCTLLASNMVGFMIWYYASHRHRLLDPETPVSAIRSTNRTFLIVNVLYVIAMLISFAHVYASYAIFFGVVIYIIIFRKEDK
jgi:uncharacterized membrane protein